MKRLFFLIASCATISALYSSEMCISLIKSGKNICCYTKCEDDCFNVQASLMERAKTCVRTRNITGTTLKPCVRATPFALWGCGCGCCCEGYLFSNCPDNACIIQCAHPLYGCFSIEQLSNACCAAGAVSYIAAWGSMEIINEFNIDSIIDALKKWSESPTFYRNDILPIDEQELPEAPIIPNDL